MVVGLAPWDRGSVKGGEAYMSWSEMAAIVLALTALARLLYEIFRDQRGRGEKER
ncbi:hypothetical protein GCM10011571_27170 [Marinithermofilum abyssi]|uniref:Uncharacterized protein n=1 Tax=Marinithermofilum abyssi TaxID=1571185 RepID=A0A8J2YEH4_9BACL|nr:hypothetical protein GCM10011571_27170 [Marinithermofilum abyssi]